MGTRRPEREFPVARLIRQRVEAGLERQSGSIITNDRLYQLPAEVGAHSLSDNRIRSRQINQKKEENGIFSDL